MLGMNTISVLLWCLTALNWEWLITAYLEWNSITHYIDIVRFLWMVTMRTWGFFADHPTSYYSYSGWNHTFKVSKSHSIDFWDFMMEFSALTVTFGFYPDLKSIKYSMKKAKKAGKKVKGATESKADADANADEAAENLEI